MLFHSEAEARCSCGSLYDRMSSAHTDVPTAHVNVRIPVSLSRMPSQFAVCGTYENRIALGRKGKVYMTRDTPIRGVRSGRRRIMQFIFSLHDIRVFQCNTLL